MADHKRKRKQIYTRASKGSNVCKEEYVLWQKYGSKFSKFFFFCCKIKLPPVTEHERKSSWPSRNGPATDVTSLPCASKTRGSSGDSVIREKERKFFD